MSDTFFTNRPIYAEDAVIKDFKISAGYIYAFENLFIYFLLNIYEDTANIADFFNRVEQYNKAAIEGKKAEVVFTEVEGHMSTIFNVLQALKAAAKTQNLDTIGKIEVPKDTMQEYLKALQDGKKEDAFKLMDKVQAIFDNSNK